MQHLLPLLCFQFAACYVVLNLSEHEGLDRLEQGSVMPAPRD